MISSGDPSLYICEDSISKENHILKFWVDMNLGRTLYHPYILLGMCGKRGASLKVKPWKRTISRQEEEGETDQRIEWEMLES